MPEGDTVAADAARLRPVLVGARIISVYGTSRSVRTSSSRILDAIVDEIRTLGKNLIIDLDDGYSVRVHLGMPGRWLVLGSEETPPGSARLVLTTGRHHAVCLAAPRIEVERTARVDCEMQRLGPDVLDEAFDPALFAERARTRGGLPVGNVLLDQRVVAGIGNVYKSELLFLVGVHPGTRVELMPDEALMDIGGKAAKLMKANIRVGPRNTTGQPGPEMWVYGRAGRPCRRCGTAIEKGRFGDRVTYWCPGCQIMST